MLPSTWTKNKQQHLLQVIGCVLTLANAIIKVELQLLMYFASYVKQMLWLIIYIILLNM